MFTILIISVSIRTEMSHCFSFDFFCKIRRVTNEKAEIIQMRLQCVGFSCAYNLNAVQF